MFVDADASRVAALESRAEYPVAVTDGSRVVIPIARALPPLAPAVTSVLDTAELVIVSVGPKNLGTVARQLGTALSCTDRGGRPLNVILCENGLDAVERFESSLGETLPAEHRTFPLGVIGSIVLTSSFASDDDPLLVVSEPETGLPIDSASIVGALPRVPALQPIDDFTSAARRKLYTYNGANAVISYLGAAAGYRLLAEAAADPRIAVIARRVYEEINATLLAHFGGTREAQSSFADRSWRKFADPSIADPIARQTRDPLRKLAPGERLVGLADLALAASIRPVGIASGIAAALRYDDPADAEAVRLARSVAEFGVKSTLVNLVGVPGDSPLIPLVADQEEIVASLLASARSPR
ncbi:hypothetical protein QT381_08230 [Galbitalea sp. SE-J8]|uniref:mannitol dehydrogenase family protein n=1 Tax=Galbitalea sp. SE-J8 TaxID=3054952 RepID=UPI00259CD60D|nr:hypothetical protein [Galbitalea sp. SE-J8]MDM4762993.1 hypothetical protein [Galbitalea sp. SE-J8]